MKSGIFDAKFKDFDFYMKLCNKRNSRALTSNMSIVFQNGCPKHPNKAFLVQELKIYIFASDLAFLLLEKFKGVNFKYDINFFKFQTRDTQNKALFLIKESKFSNLLYH